MHRLWSIVGLTWAQHSRNKSPRCFSIRHIRFSNFEKKKKFNPIKEEREREKEMEFVVSVNSEQQQQQQERYTIPN